MKRLLVLGRNGVNESDDFDGWVNWVCAHVDGACGFEVDVDTAQPRDVQEDRILGCTDEERQILHEAIQMMWDNYCSEGAPQ